MSRPSGSSVFTPNEPTVKAIAPNAPIGATFMIRATIRKKTCDVRSSTSISGFAVAPMEVSATPNSTAKKTICRISPLAKASTTLVGTMCVRKSTNPMFSLALAYCVMSPFASADTSTPSPGRVTFTITRPMPSAKVVTISK